MNLEILNGMNTIQLTQGLNTLVETIDWINLRCFNWRALRNHGSSIVYAGRNKPRADKNQPKVYLHRVIAQQATEAGLDGLEVDHRNRDPLDNRRANLRPATRRQNSANIRKPRGILSVYKGVTRDKRGKWIAQCGPEGSGRYLGAFQSEADAARAYDARAVELYGEFAGVNFPSGKEAG